MRTPILVRHFLFGFTDGPTPWSAVFAGSIDKWTDEGFPTSYARQVASLDLSRLRMIDRAFLRASPARRRALMHQCMRDHAMQAGVRREHFHVNIFLNRVSARFSGSATLLVSDRAWRAFDMTLHATDAFIGHFRSRGPLAPWRAFDGGNQ